jgi:signal transduction histidine kinase
VRDTPQSPRRRPPVNEALVDAALAGALAVLTVTTTLAPDDSVSYDFAEPDGRTVVLCLLGSLSLAWRRRLPAAVLATVLAAAVAVVVGGWNSDPLAGCLMFALYSIAAWQRTAVAVAGLAAVFLVMGTFVVAQVPWFDSPLVVVSFAAFGLVWVFGLAVRRVRLSREAAVARALEAERTRAVAAERAVFAERLRIARELHDVVSHTLSVIAVQSSVARHLLEPAAASVGPALGAIEDASRTALADLRRMLGVLRTDADDEGAGFAPAPGLPELQLLASAHRAGSGPVELTVGTGLEEAPESMRQAAFRLVQEALTNARKHAPGAPVTVVVRAVDGDVLVRVDDDGPARPGARIEDGYGLAGMRERVALFDGTLEAGPQADGGFRVQARLRRPAGSVVPP